MYYLDIQTMLFITVFVLFWTASLMLLASFQLRRDPCLFWMAMGSYLASLGLICSALNLFLNLELQVIWLGNILLITAHACVWCAMRRFSDKSLSVWLLLAGAILWSVLCLSDTFMASPLLRVTIYSLLCIAYIAAATTEVIYLWRHNLHAVVPMVGVMLAYMLAYTYRIFNWQYEFQFWVHRFDSSLTIFASLIMSIGISFSALTLVKGRAENHYRYVSLHDELTGLLNRRALFSSALSLFEIASLKRHSTALLMFDLDWFKKINDRYGHHAGDKVLCDFARLLKENHREQDICARIGGEEFVLVLPNVGVDQLMGIIARINNSIAYWNSKAVIPISVSIGAAWAEDHDYCFDAVLMAADAALYKAKSDGRNCMRFWSKELDFAPKTSSSN